jgi:hypothetical protein
LALSGAFKLSPLAVPPSHLHYTFDSEGNRNHHHQLSESPKRVKYSLQFHQTSLPSLNYLPRHQKRPLLRVVYVVTMNAMHKISLEAKAAMIANLEIERK